MLNNLPTQISNTISIIFDSVAIVLLLTIAITSFMFHDKKQKTIRRLMLACTLFGSLAAASDIAYTILYGSFETSNLLFDTSKINAVILAIFLLVKSNFTYYYVDSSKRSNLPLKYASAFLALFLIVVTAIPSLYSLVNRFSNSRLSIDYSLLQISYIVALFLIELSSFIAIIKNFKNLALQNAIVLALFQLLPVVVFFVSGEVISIALFFMAVFLLIAYIILFQGGTIRSYQQEKEIAQINVENKEMSTKLLVSQIQPHFLYNTLSSIAYYCKKDPEIAQELTHNFSTYLRNNIDSIGGESIITFEQELEHVKTYLSIEKVRFGDRIKDQYDTKVMNFTLPSLSIQPLVENAVKHGLCKKEDGGTVTITTYYDDDYLLIKIIDDGVGFDETAGKDDGRSHVGIENVRERLRLLCNAELLIDSEIGVGTTATIRIPKEIKG